MTTLFATTRPRAARAATIAVVLSLAFAPLLATAQTASASAPIASVRQPFEVDVATDVAIVTAAAGLWLGGVALQDDMMRPPCSSCGAGMLAIDRGVVGKYDFRARAASDVLLITAVTAPFVLSLVDNLSRDQDSPMSEWATDSLILMQALMISGMINQSFKVGFQRPRPFTYDPYSFAGDRASDDASLSFYSGHASIAFTMAVAYSYMFQQRHPDSPLVVPVWVVSLGLASATGVMRVEAGKHFWSDVITGALIGSAVGYLVPALHMRGSDRWGGMEIRFGAGTTEHGGPMLTVNGTF